VEEEKKKNLGGIGERESVGKSSYKAKTVLEKRVGRGGGKKDKKRCNGGGGGGRNEAVWFTRLESSVTFN